MATTTTKATETQTMTPANDQGLAPATRVHPGSCHCGAVRFEVELPERLGGIALQLHDLPQDQHHRRDREAGRASSCWRARTTCPAYAWGGKTARRYFCKTCGVHCFARGYLAEVGGDYVSINLNAIDDIEVDQLPLVYWDGRHNNWYAGTRATPWPIFSSPPAAWSDPLRPAPASNS